jgi:hypothetical protein
MQRSLQISVQSRPVEYGTRKREFDGQLTPVTLQGREVVCVQFPLISFATWLHHWRFLYYVQRTKLDCSPGPVKALYGWAKVIYRVSEATPFSHKDTGHPSLYMTRLRSMSLYDVGMLLTS